MLLVRGRALHVHGTYVRVRGYFLPSFLPSFLPCVVGSPLGRAADGGACVRPVGPETHVGSAADWRLKYPMKALVHGSSLDAALPPRPALTDSGPRRLGMQLRKTTLHM